MHHEEDALFDLRKLTAPASSVIGSCGLWV
jgi:hypothetical protein